MKFFTAFMDYITGRSRRRFEMFILEACSDTEVNGREIIDEYEDARGKSCNEGSVYVALDRLHDKGLVAKRNAIPTDRNPDIRVRYWKITRKGEQVLAEYEREMGV